MFCERKTLFPTNTKRVSASSVHLFCRVPAHSSAFPSLLASALQNKDTLLEITFCSNRKQNKPRNGQRAALTWSNQTSFISTPLPFLTSPEHGSRHAVETLIRRAEDEVRALRRLEVSVAHRMGGCVTVGCRQKNWTVAEPGVQHNRAVRCVEERAGVIRGVSQHPHIIHSFNYSPCCSSSASQQRKHLLLLPRISSGPAFLEVNSGTAKRSIQVKFEVRRV